MSFRKWHVLLFLNIFIFTASITAQPWADGVGDNFYSIKNNFYKWSNNKSTVKLQKSGNVAGYKQFKRWEWFWEQRVYPTGNFPAAGHLQLEKNKYYKTHKNKSSFQAITPNWTNLGPSTSLGGYAGLGRLNTVAIDPNDANTILVGAASGGIWKSTNKGSSWTALTDDFTSMGISCIVYKPGNSNTVYCATGDMDGGDTYTTGILKSTDGGTTWNATGLSFATSATRRIGKIVIDPSDHNVIYTCGNIGVYKTTDAGANWSQVETGTFYDLEMKHGDPNTIYASGSTIIRSQDAGANWSTLTTGAGTPRRIAIAVTPDDTGYLYALYADNSDYGMLGLFRSVDSGDNWTERYDGTNDYMGYYSDGSVHGGQGFYDICIAADPNDKETVYIGGVNIVKSADGGSSWTTVATWTSSGAYNKNGSAEVHADQHDLLFAPDNSTLYVCNDGGLYSTANAGTSFNWLGSGLEITQFYRIGTATTSSTKVIAGAQDNGTKLLKSGSWSDVIGGDGMECIINSDNESIMYGTYVNGDLRKSINGGSSFSSNIFTGGETGSWVTPYELDPSDPSTIIAGYVNVWKSTNDGSTWSSIGGNTGASKISVLHIAPSDADYIYQSTGSNLKYTSNGGSSWNTVTKPGTGSLTYLAIDPETPTTLWATLSGYTSGSKVYKSTDAGSNWSNVSGSLPNVPMNTIVYEPNSNDMLYVGTDIGVWYRDGSSGDWTAYNTGLPSVVINELEIHSGDSKLNASTYGRGLWQADLVQSDSSNDSEEEDDQDGVTSNIENNAPNSGDGNNDGVLDGAQSSVTSLLDGVGGSYVTLEVVEGYDLQQVSTDVTIDDDEYAYPFGVFDFKVSQSEASIKLYFHSLSYKDQNYVYRKLNADNEWVNFDDAVFGTEVINGLSVLTVTLNLTDGGDGDYDGVINGIIHDPGGIGTIPIGIPSMSKFSILLLILSISIVSFIFIRRYSS